MYTIIQSMTGKQYFIHHLWIIAVPVFGKRVQRRYPWIQREMKRLGKDLWRDQRTTDTYLRYFADTYNDGKMYVKLTYSPPSRSECRQLEEKHALYTEKCVE